MDALLEDQTLQAVLGRTDFSGIDNAALDFSQLEEYINDEANNNIYFQDGLINSNENNNRLVTVESGGTTFVSNSHLTSVLLNGSNAVLIANGTGATTPESIGKNHLLGAQDYNSYTITNGTGTNTTNTTLTGTSVPTSSSSLNLPDSPPDSGSEPPFSPSNESDNTKLVSSTSCANTINGTSKSSSQSTKTDQLVIQQQQLQPPTSTETPGMENMKHFAEYSSHHPLNIKLETSLTNMPHQLHAPSHPTHISHHHAHLGPHHHSVPSSMEGNTQIPLLPPDGSPISQMVSIGPSLSVSSAMMTHGGLVPNGGGPVHTAAMLHTNGAHLYGTGGSSDDYQSIPQSHYQSHVAPPPPPPPPPGQQHQQSPVPGTQSAQPPSSTPQSATANKKRKVSEVQSKSMHNGTGVGNGSGPSSANIYIKQEPSSLSPDSALHGSGNSSCTSSNNGSNVHSTQQCEDEYFDYGPDSQMYVDSFYQCIRFTPFNPTASCPVLDINFKEITQLSYRVDADKGFNFSNADDAFVCQKKNHFQVTVHAQTLITPVYVKVGEGNIQKIEHFYLHFYGVKVESPTQTIKVEQSQSDRSKKAFHPVRIELSSEHVCKMTVGRLHFSETTSNNMRKKGKPNPDQRYFYLVVSLCAHVGEQVYQLAAQASERIIVRASNPGQFENDVELLWQKGTVQDTIFHSGKVGINTDRPDESLVVYGNAKVTGNIMQPSDERAKTNIEEIDTRAQLKNVSNMRIVRYQFKPGFAKQVGINAQELDGTGILAQEVQKILPEAVKQTGDIVLPNGETIENFLVVNKDRIFMENLGAVKELCKVTDNLETRIDELERMNVKLSKFNRFDSIKSVSSSSIFSRTSTSNTCSSQSGYHNRTCRRSYHKSCNTTPMPTVCTNRFIQSVTMILVLIMALCLVSIAGLYILEYHRRHDHPTLMNHHHPTNTYYTHDSSPYQIPNYHSSPNVNHHQYNPPHITPSYQTSYVHNSVSDSFKDKKQRSQSDSYLTSAPNTRHPRPTAIPILKPQVLGIPYGCLDTSSPTLSSSTCVQYCCLDDGYNAHNTPSTSTKEPMTMTPKDDDDRSYQSKGQDVKLMPNRTTQSSTTHSINSSSDIPSTSASTIVGKIVPPPILPPQPIGGNYFEPVPPHSKFDSNEQTNVNKKKRTDKGFSFGKYSGAGSIQDIHSMNDYFASKSNRRRRRRRRETGKSIGMSSQTIDNYPRKDFSRTVELIKLLELNATIDYSYCTKLQCMQGVGSKFDYIIPISKYMDLEYVTLQFSLNQEMKVDHCALKEVPISCQTGHYDNIPQSYKKGPHHILMPESNPHWRLPIGIYQHSSYVFRILARNVDADSPCSLPDSQTGISFVEYKFDFVRKCDK